MLLKLIKTRPMNTGTHAELWSIDSINGDKKLADVFVLYEHLPLALIYPIRVIHHRLHLRGHEVGWQWDKPEEERQVVGFLLEIQCIHEEIYLDICDPKPDLPGYPEVDYNPDDYPIVFM